MAWTQSTVDQIEAAIVTAAVDGVAEANFDGRGMKRYSLTELLKLRTAVMVSVQNAATNASSNPTRCTYAKFDKG